MYEHEQQRYSLREEKDNKKCKWHARKDSYSGVDKYPDGNDKTNLSAWGKGEMKH